MRLGKASTYAVFATVYLADHLGDGPIQGRFIAEEYGIPAEYLLKIMQQLVRAQVLKSERGRGGGFTLGKAPSKVSLLDIVEAIEGPVNGELSLRREIRGAETTKDKVQQACTTIAEHSRSVLRKMTIKHLARNGN
ncbi:MAG: Rrf2 family transcriptional regulator [Planctomycetota bacterium]